MAAKVGKKAEYRSALRSRKMIKKAFVELMQEKDWQKITVTDIVNRCDLNRGTFYAHYPNVRAVLEQIENEMISSLDELLAMTKSYSIDKEPMPILVKITSYLESEIDFYRMLANSTGAEQFSAKLKELLIEKITNNDELDIEPQRREEFEIATRFMAGGFVSLYFDWFKGKVNCSLEEICATVNRLMVNTFKPFSNLHSNDDFTG